MDKINSLKPCLVNARQGVSVFYKERFLYSKYCPEKSILDCISNFTVLPDTLILLFSPCLFLGINELLAKLNENCFLLALEDEQPLYELAEHQISKLNLKADRLKLSSTENIEQCLESLPKFKRVISLSMSGGTFFHEKEYLNAEKIARNYTGTFWKNHVTLVRLGRLFSRNLIRNLKFIPQKNSVSLICNKITRPIFVFGAGESIEVYLTEPYKSYLKNFTVICVDAALPVLQSCGVEWDFFVAQESQLAVEKAYIGVNLRGTGLFDMASRNSIIKKFKGEKYFFASEYAESSFFKTLENNKILPKKIPPLGSVGLTSVFLALLMRKTADVPVFFAGLDFSFSTGKTHARGTPAHIAKLSSCSRFVPVENYDAAFKIGAQIVQGKNSAVTTDKILLSYASLFNDFFSNAANLYNAGNSGIKLGTLEISKEQVLSFAKSMPQKKHDENKNFFEQQLAKNREDFSESQKITENFLKKEKESLVRLRELLVHGENVFPPPYPSLNEEIKSLLSARDYLYLHFPDSYKKNFSDLSFLKRVRTEIEFFLKDFS